MGIHLCDRLSFRSLTCSQARQGELLLAMNAWLYVTLIPLALLTQPASLHLCFASGFLPFFLYTMLSCHLHGCLTVAAWLLALTVSSSLVLFSAPLLDSSPDLSLFCLVIGHSAFD